MSFRNLCRDLILTDGLERLKGQQNALPKVAFDFGHQLRRGVANEIREALGFKRFEARSHSLDS